MFSPLFLCVCLESCKQRLILKHQRRCYLFLKSKNKEFSFLSRPSWCSEGLRGAASSDHDTFSSWHFVRMSDILPSLSKPLGAASLIFSNFLSCIFKMCGCPTRRWRAPRGRAQLQVMPICLSFKPVKTKCNHRISPAAERLSKCARFGRRGQKNKPHSK